MYERLNNEAVLTAECLQQRSIRQIKKAKPIIGKTKDRIEPKLKNDQLKSLGLDTDEGALSWLNLLKRYHFNLTSPNSERELLSDTAGSQDICSPTLPVNTTSVSLM